MPLLDQAIAAIDLADPLQMRGTVAEVLGLAVHVADLTAPIGAMTRILTQGGHGPVVEAEVVGFNNEQTVLMPLGPTQGIRRGDSVLSEQSVPLVRVGHSLRGRVLSASGQPIDGKGPLTQTSLRPLAAVPIDPLERPSINVPLAVGIRAVDAMTSLGRGQRIGIFASPGLGKSTLLGMMARHTAADVSVIALVGERGREVRDFVDHHLGPDGLARSVVVCATSDEPAVRRIRAALLATAVAEYFRQEGLDVLLIMDSLTRFCQAQRQVGLSAGEPPTTRGYPPSVFAILPTLLERCGRTNQGSITGLFAVLTEGDELTDPVADASRGILDGHIQLSRRLAQQAHWPAIDVLASISRVADDVISREHRAARDQVIRLLSAYHQVEDLLNIGAYASGSNSDFDLAIAAKPAIDQFLQQGRHEVQGTADFARTGQQLLALNIQIENLRKQMSRQRPAPPPGPGRNR
ncbi:MAG: FliI/YscN family ATPase [Phycisphaeraceae bacterium]|nr:FliI/YscN family ATPase [Phycisphaeraceae bacterium]